MIFYAFTVVQLFLATPCGPCYRFAFPAWHFIVRRLCAHLVSPSFRFYAAYVDWGGCEEIFSYLLWVSTFPRPLEEAKDFQTEISTNQATGTKAARFLGAGS